MTTVRAAAVRGMLPAIDNVECGMAANWKEMVAK